MDARIQSAIPAGTAFNRSRSRRTGSCDRSTVKTFCRGKFLFTALILDCLTPVSELPSEHINEIQHSFQEYLAQKGFQALDFVKTDRFIIYFICSNEKPEKTILINCATDLKDRFKGLTSFFLPMGPVVLGFKRASFSFEAARELLKRSFFHDPDTLLMEAENEVANQPLTDITMDLTVALTNKNEEAALLPPIISISLYTAARQSPPARSVTCILSIWWN